MPMRSKAQNRFMHAAASSPKTARKLGIPQKTAQKFVAESHGQKVGKLPERKMAKGGFVRPKQSRNADIERGYRGGDELRAQAQERMNRRPPLRNSPIADPVVRAAKNLTDDVASGAEIGGALEAFRKAKAGGRREYVTKEPRDYARGGSVKADGPSCKW